MPGIRPRRSPVVAAALACTGALAASPALAEPSSTGAGVETIVQMNPGTTPAQGRAVVARHGGSVIGEVPIIHGLVARVPSPRLAGLRREAAIRAATRNGRVAATAGVSTRNLRTAYPLTVDAPVAWSPAWGSVTGRGVGVAVIDTGVDGGIVDFQRSSWDRQSRVVAAVRTNPNATTVDDEYGHGTHVAGIIAGNGNNRTDAFAGRYVGIAPRANLVSVKVSDDQGIATVLDVIYGLQFAVDMKDRYNIRVINMSLTSTVAGPASTDPLNAATEEAWNRGIVVVAAAGNRGSGDGAVDYAPGNDPFVITVGATDDQDTSTRSDDTVASWSSAGTTQEGVAKPEIYAPGAHMVSTLAPGSDFTRTCPTCVVDDQYIRAGGTSMSAPVVSGIVALMLERRPWLTPNQVKGTLIATSERVADDAVPEADAARAVYASGVYSSNRELAPNALIDPATGGVDPARSSWSRSSWSSAPDPNAGWSRSSWSCECSLNPDGSVDPTWSSWSRSSWSTSWSK